jgi:hypothetical protein
MGARRSRRISAVFEPTRSGRAVSPSFIISGAAGKIAVAQMSLFATHFLIWAMAAWFGIGTLGLIMPIAIAATSAAMNGMSLRIIAHLPPLSERHPLGCDIKMGTAEGGFWVACVT